MKVYQETLMYDLCPTLESLGIFYDYYIDLLCVSVGLVCTVAHGGNVTIQALSVKKQCFYIFFFREIRLVVSDNGKEVITVSEVLPVP